MEDLSAATGMTARNVRAYQTKGLIPPPTRQGRRSVYGVEHLRRLQAIERARSRGASLSLIASHLAQGNPLDEDTLIGWGPGGRPADPGGGEPRANGGGRRPARAHRTDIAALLAALDHQRDPTAQASVEELIAAGVFQLEGRRVYTGRDLAAALTALQRQGLPIEAALGIAQRSMAAAGTIADAVRQSLGRHASIADTASVQLGELAVCVVRHVVADTRRD